MLCLKLRILILQNVEASIGFAYVYRYISYNALFFFIPCNTPVIWTFKDQTTNFCDML